MVGKRWAAWLVCAGVLLSGRAAADALSDAGTAFDAAERGNYKLAVRYYTRALWAGELSDDEAAAVPSPTSSSRTTTRRRRITTSSSSCAPTTPPPITTAPSPMRPKAI